MSLLDESLKSEYGPELEKWGKSDSWGRAKMLAREDNMGSGDLLAEAVRKHIQTDPQTGLPVENTYDPAFDKVSKFVVNEDYGNAWQEFLKLDPKKYTGNPQYEQLKQQISWKLGINGLVGSS